MSGKKAIILIIWNHYNSFEFRKYVLDIGRGLMHYLPGIGFRDIHRSCEFAEDAADPVVAVIVQSLYDHRAAAAGWKYSLHILVINLVFYIRDIHKQVADHLWTELCDIRNGQVLDVRFHRLYTFPLDLEVYWQEVLIPQWMRLHYIYPVSLQLVQ